ncbi:MAG: hypothetical protein ACP5G1_04150 [Nanopusillaceae archaeon]
MDNSITKVDLRLFLSIEQKVRLFELAEKWNSSMREITEALIDLLLEDQELQEKVRERIRQKSLESYKQK